MDCEDPSMAACKRFFRNCFFFQLTQMAEMPRNSNSAICIPVDRPTTADELTRCPPPLPSPSTALTVPFCSPPLHFSVDPSPIAPTQGPGSAPHARAYDARTERAMRWAQGAAFLLLALLPAAAAEACDRGWECIGSSFCCNGTITDFFKARHFEEFFPRRNDSIAHAAGFWGYQAFIAAAALFEPRGFGTTGGEDMGVKEIAAFLAHVGASTSCGRFYPNPMAWGLCYKRELSPYQNYYCDDSNELYRCVEGVEYYGRGALPVYWNYNYGLIGKGIKQDLLSHPELLEQNATLAFEAAIWRWMTPMKWRQPSAHDAFVGNWKPTKNDLLSKRYPGFGITMNIMRGDRICGRGFTDEMNITISHYQYYLDLMGVTHEHSGRSLDCADQVVFNPSSKSFGS